MTKRIRIENADTSTHNVDVEIWSKGTAMDTLVRTIKLDYPTEMTDSNVYVHSTQYIVIREVGPRV